MKPIEIEELLQATRDDNPKNRKSALLNLCTCRVKTNNAKIWDRLLVMRSDDDAGVAALYCTISVTDRQKSEKKRSLMRLKNSLKMKIAK